MEIEKMNAEGTLFIFRLINWKHLIYMKAANKMIGDGLRGLSFLASQGPGNPIGNSKVQPYNAIQ